MDRPLQGRSLARAAARSQPTRGGARPRPSRRGNALPQPARKGRCLLAPTESGSRSCIGRLPMARSPVAHAGAATTTTA
ncbi:hypothetical protein GW17_00059825 [Ensete ventricosum]|nr:hypothetical protein GW17_00059825 [Ensete ventricosum]